MLTNLLKVLRTARLRLGRIELNRSGVGPTLTNILRGRIVRRCPNTPSPNGVGFTETNLVHPDVLPTRDPILPHLAISTCLLPVR